MTKDLSTYETSKALDDLGFRGESEWHYITDTPTPALVKGGLYRMGKLISIPAYSFSEVWAALPYKIKAYSLNISKTGDGSTVTSYESQFLAHSTEYDPCLIATMHKSPTEAACLLLIWAIENGHVTV
jgi:hypothetical protein